MNIGETLRMLRKQRGYSQEELAKKANLSRTYITLLESNESNPTVETLEIIGKALEVPFPIISFLTLDINNIPENKRDDYKKIEPTIMSMIEDFFIKNVVRNS